MLQVPSQLFIVHAISFAVTCYLLSVSLCAHLPFSEILSEVGPFYI